MSTEAARSPARVLMVDADGDIAGFVRGVLLEIPGIAEVVLAETPVVALNILGRERFDLVITEANTVGSDAYALVRNLRARLELANLRIMFLTTRGSPENIAEGYACGADDYMVKPFDPIELRAHVRALLRRGHRKPNHLTDG